MPGIAEVSYPDAKMFNFLKTSETHEGQQGLLAARPMSVSLQAGNAVPRSGQTPSRGVCSQIRVEAVGTHSRAHPLLCPDGQDGFAGKEHMFGEL